MFPFIEKFFKLDKLGVSAFKIASVDLVNIPLIEHVAKKLKPIIISTGMSKISEIDDAVEAVKSTGNNNLVLLHCNSSYPSTYAEVNLKLYDVRGSLVETLLSKRVQAGSHDHVLNASHLSSGVYFYTMTVNDVSQTKKLILMK